MILVDGAVDGRCAALRGRATRSAPRKTRVFFTVTLPGAKYGVISAGFVMFTLVITDFGIAKVIGGQFNVLATDIYKQVIGQQNFEMGAVVGFVLLVPAVLAFVVDRIVQRRQVALLSARAVPLEPQAARRAATGALFAFCAVVGGADPRRSSRWRSGPRSSRCWPYNLTLTLEQLRRSAISTPTAGRRTGTRSSWRPGPR